MIGGDDVYRAFREFRPQAGLRFVITQRRGAFRHSAQTFQVFRREIEVMWTRLDGNIHAACTRFRRDHDAATGTDVDDVQARTGFSGHQRSSVNSLDFRENRTGAQEPGNGRLALHGGA